MSRLSQRERDEIVTAYRSGESPTAIGRRYGVSKAYAIMLARHPYQRKTQVKAPEPVAPRIRIALPPPIQANHPSAMVITPKHMGSGRNCGAGYLKLI